MQDAKIARQLPSGPARALSRLSKIFHLFLLERASEMVLLVSVGFSDAEIR